MSTPAGIAALETLRQLGFRLDSSTGAHRLIRQDGSQAALYDVRGGFGTGVGHLGNVTDISADNAAVNAVPIAQAILQDEAQRLAMPRFQLPSIASKPYG